MDFEMEPLESPTSAPGVIAALVEVSEIMGFVIPPSWKAIAGRHAKTLLAGGVPPDTVIAACWISILRGRPQIAQHVAGDLMLARSGLRMDRREYEQKLAVWAADQNDGMGLLREAQRRRRR